MNNEKNGNINFFQILLATAYLTFSGCQNIGSLFYFKIRFISFSIFFSIPALGLK